MDLNGPRGKDISEQLGRSYFVIANPVFGRGFVCRWHRMERAGHTDPRRAPETNYGRTINPLEEDLAHKRDLAMGKLPCEGIGGPWPDGVNVETLLRQDLPVALLPDARSVFFVPDSEFFGSILPHAWKKLVDNAKAARGELVTHAYKVTLDVLRFWKVIGPEMAERRKRREALRAEDKSTWEFDGAVDPSGRDGRIESWIFYWARPLHDDPCKKFIPFQEARQVLSRATGYGPQAIGTIVGRT